MILQLGFHKNRFLWTGLIKQPTHLLSSMASLTDDVLGAEPRATICRGNKYAVRPVSTLFTDKVKVEP